LNKLGKALGTALGISFLHLAGCTTDLGGGTPSFRTGFVYVRRDDRNVYLADDSASSVPIPITSGGENFMPALSKDASEIVFVHGSGANAEIDTNSVSAASGTAPTRVVTSDPSHSNFRNPLFSPDGSYIVFAYDSNGSSMLGRVSATGGSIQRIIGGSSRSYTSPSFFPGGSQLLAASGSTPANYDSLEQVSITGTASLLAVLPNETFGLANRAQISPDGNHIALDALSQASGASWLYAYNIAGGTYTRLVYYPAAPLANETFPTWVGTSQVGYSSDFGGGDEVYVVASSAHDGSGVLKVPSAIEPFYAPY
jgi:Tol biopolymer transport system component